MSVMGTKLLFSTAYHPQTDGQSEHSIHSILQILGGFVYQHPDHWQDYLPLVELYYNITIQSSIGKSHVEVVFGHQLVQPFDLVDTTTPIVAQESAELQWEAKQAINGAQQCQAGYIDEHCKHISFEPGDFVLLLTKHLPLKLPGFRKLKPLWVGPY